MDPVEKVLLEIRREMMDGQARGESEAQVGARLARLARRVAALPPFARGAARRAFLLLAAREGEAVSRMAVHALGESGLARPADFDALLAERAFGSRHAAALRAVRDAVRLAQPA
jgi:hypothetical protein